MDEGVQADDLMDIGLGADEEVDEGGADVEEIRLLAGSGSLWSLCGLYSCRWGSSGRSRRAWSRAHCSNWSLVLDELSQAELRH